MSSLTHKPLNRHTTRSILLTAIALASIASADEATPSQNAPGVSPDSILYYKPQNAGNLILGILYVCAAIALWFNLLRKRDWWALAFPIGVTLQGVGFFLRLPMRDDPSNLALYVVQTFFVVIAPCVLFAFQYVLFGRLSYNLQHDPTIPKRKPSVTLLNPLLFGRIFILSDVFTFIIQAIGGSFEVSDSLQYAGSKIFLAGIVAQGVSYAVFMACSIYTHWVITLPGAYSHPLYRNIQKLFLVLHSGSLFIVIRSIYRTIEMAQGFRGYLITHEIYFFLLDSIPLLLFNLGWIIFWPTDLVPLRRSQSGFATEDDAHVQQRETEEKANVRLLASEE
ncbi:hypothetical protein OC846_003542 [Tilletia horrida]|uniref:RTA1-domain-containing protein n=1 Tax=Tilletia horrida TaxID=155126 RepID=A0AAN6GNX7_9BASI|nr:hypothetical protein OC846_003542 [Tilletia horrida]